MRNVLLRLTVVAVAGVGLLGLVAGGPALAAPHEGAATALSPPQKLAVDAAVCASFSALSLADRNDAAAAGRMAGRAIAAWLETQPNIAAAPDLVAAATREAIKALEGCGMRPALLAEAAARIAAAVVAVAPVAAADVFAAAIEALPDDQHGLAAETRIAAAIDGSLPGAATQSAPRASGSGADPTVAAILTGIGDEPVSSPFVPPTGLPVGPNPPNNPHPFGH